MYVEAHASSEEEKRNTVDVGINWLSQLLFRVSTHFKSHRVIIVGREKRVSREEFLFYAQLPYILKRER